MPKKSTTTKPAAPKKSAAKIKQFEIMAVIPTGPYANVQPKIIVESEDFEQAYALAMPKIEKVSQDYGSEGVILGARQQGYEATEAPASTREPMVCWASGDVAYFDEVSHTYVDENGNQYMSGSVYAGQFEYDFNKAMILPKSANKLGCTEQELSDMWESKGDIATTFGTALHKSLEHYGKWKDLCDLTGKGTGIHPTLLPIVEAFFTPERLAEDAEYEPFVADKDNLRCGQIDRLVIEDRGLKTCYIEDYKTNGDLYKRSPGSPTNLKAPYSFLPNVPMGRYTIQLSFYKAILEAKGWTVLGLRVHHWAGSKWETTEIKAVDLDVPQEKIDVSQIL